nr:MAG TPA: hypothetical protein [Caudoviricetes sp.]
MKDFIKFLFVIASATVGMLIIFFLAIVIGTYS